MERQQEFPFRRPKPNRAKRFAKQAAEAARMGAVKEAIELIEQAIRFDQLNGLNRYYLMRAEYYQRLGQDDPMVAIGFYSHACKIKKQGRFLDATVAYQECFKLDEFFLWPFNNYAWLLSTGERVNIREGKEALKYAQLVCEKSGYNCWAFLGTLAAAYAESGDFERAVGWQLSALKLVPLDHKLDAVIQLRYYQMGLPYTDEGTPAAAGG